MQWNSAVLLWNEMNNAARNFYKNTVLNCEKFFKKLLLQKEHIIVKDPRRWNRLETKLARYKECNAEYADAGTMHNCKQACLSRCIYLPFVNQNGISTTITNYIAAQRRLLWCAMMGIKEPFCDKAIWYCKKWRKRILSDDDEQIKNVEKRRAK